MSKLSTTLAIALCAVLYDVGAREIDTSIYTLTSSGHKQIESYKVGDSINIICHHELNISLVRPEHNDKIIAINYYKDKVLFFRNGNGTEQTFPIKGITDVKGVGYGILSHEVEVNDGSGGANYYTAGSYACEVIYDDYLGNRDSIKSAVTALKLIQ